MTNSIPSEYGMAYSFDNQTDFRSGIEYVSEGGLTSSQIGLSSSADHTQTLLGNGKSLKISGWSTSDDKIYLLNMLSNKALEPEDFGRAFRVTAYINPTVSGDYYVGMNSLPNEINHNNSAYISTSCTARANEWTRLQFTFILTKEMCESGIENLVIGQTATSAGAILYVDDITVNEIGKGISFDDKTAITEGTDYLVSGGSTQSIALSSNRDFYERVNTGKSLSISGRTSATDRILLKNIFPTDVKGAAYKISCNIYSPKSSTYRIGIYSESGEYTVTPYKYNDISVKANEWVKCDISFIVDDVINTSDISLFGVSEAGSFENELFCIDNVISETDGYLYKNTSGKTADELFENLKSKSSDVIYTPSQQITRVNEKAGGSGLTLNMFPDFAAKVVSVDGPCFTQAVHYSIKSKPSPAYKFQLNIGAIAKNSDGSRIVDTGDWIVGVVYIKALSSSASDNKCHLQFAVQDSVTSGKVLQADTYADVGEGFKKIYIASKVSSYSNDLNLFVRCGYEIQEVEIGGVQLYRYSGSVITDESEIPDTASLYDGMEPFSDWRTEAAERIETVRKGIITLKVKDANGNPIENCDVKLDMTNHDFQFGTTGSNLITKSTTDAAIYTSKLTEYFNAAVPESELKWVSYEKDPTGAVNLVSQLKNLGIKYVRGHCLMWDCDYYDGKWKTNTAIPYELSVAVDNNNRTSVDSIISSHISSEMNAFSQYNLCDWDVVNEITYNHAITEKYDRQPLLDWFAWANFANSSGSDLYINEAALTGAGDNELIAFKEYLNYMVENNCDFDGIGLQGHFGNPCSIIRYKNQLDDLSHYGKRLKITEYDIQKEGMIQAEFTRDMMILAFSTPQMDGFYNWGFWDGAHWQHNGILYDSNWNLKQSGEEYQDLVLNRWESHNEGLTNKAGEYTSRAYYGEYAVKVTVNGREYNKNIDFNSLGDNVIEINTDYSDISENYTVLNNTSTEMNVTQAVVDGLGQSLVYGKTAETNLSNAGDISILTDGKIFLKFQDDATYIAVSGIQPTFTFDMGADYDISNILVGGSCMGSRDITLAQYELYVSQSSENLYSSSNLVATYDNKGVFDAQVGGWTNSMGSAQIFVFNNSPKGRYFGIKILKANNYDSYLRLSELGIYGQKSMQKQSAEAPEMPVLIKKTSTTVKLQKVDGLEYSIDGSTWQISSDFNGLSAGVHTFYARVAETDTHLASPASSALNIRVHAMGDIDGNELVNATDITILRKKLLGIDVFADIFAVDVNEDESVDIKDIVRIKKIMSNIQ